MFAQLMTPEFWHAHTDYLIFGLLGLMSFVMLWKVLERYFFYRRLDVTRYHSLHELNIDLEANLTAIYTVGSNAPYVGLLGTVVGILLTFLDMGKHGGQIDSAQIMVGLALALKATALGILVAIPSIMFYNGLARMVEVRRLQFQAWQERQHHKALFAPEALQQLLKQQSELLQKLDPKRFETARSIPPHNAAGV